MLRNPGRLVPKDELLNAGWGDTAVTENSLTRNIALLRRLLDDDTRAPRYIETVSTVGYRFICPVEASEDSSAGSDAAAPEMERNNSSLSHGLKIAPSTRAKSELGLRSWLLLALAAVSSVALALGYLHLSRPMPQLRVTEYTKITHDGRPKELAGTDGSRIYLNRNYDPQRAAQVAISGGEIAPVPVALPLPWISDVSPDGSTLLVTTSDGAKGAYGTFRFQQARSDAY